MIPFQWRLLKQLDWILLLSALFLTGIGFATLFSIEPALFLKQSGALGIALLAFIAMVTIDFRILKPLAPWLYTGGVLLLIIVLFAGSQVYGAQRWLVVGPLQLQPSEVAKMTLIILLASFFANAERRKTLRDSILPSFLWFLLPFFLIFRQPDLGTATILLGILLGLLLWAEIPRAYLVALLAPIVSFLLAPLPLFWWGFIILCVLIFFLSKLDSREAFFFSVLTAAAGLAFPLFWRALHAYQKARFLAFLRPENDPHGLGYHAIQSKIAIGSGGFWGKGYLAGTQTQLNFIPEQATDFVFSAIGEEGGLLLSCLLIVLFAILLWRVFTIARSAPDRFGQFLACGLGTMLLLHFFINTGMTLGLLPVVGMPLPFVSAGGTSLVIHWLALGILQSIAIRKQRLLF